MPLFTPCVLCLMVFMEFKPVLSSSSSPASQFHTEQENDRHEPSLLLRPVLRVKNMSVAEFKNKFSRSDVALPMVFEAPTDFDVSLWTREAFADECGDVPMIMDEDGCGDRRSAAKDDSCHNVRIFNPDLVGKEWAGLEVADLEEHNVTTLKDMIDRQDTPSGSGLYLHDASLSHYCPSAAERLRVPKYFTRNYKILTADPQKVDRIGEDSHFPSIFISKKGTGSRLHSDAYMTRFWCQQLSGTKRWRLVPPSEFWRMSPEERDEYYPTVFAADILNPDFDAFPALDGALVYDTVLRPGDVLFSPESWGHQVINLEDAVMTSMNFVDNDSLDAAYKSGWRDNELEDHEVPLWKAVFMPLDDPLWDDNREVTFDDFFRAQHLQREPVPSSIREWVSEKGQDGVNAYKDDRGMPLLHIVVEYNFMSIVEFLLKDALVDVNARNLDNETALDIAVNMGLEDAAQLLREYDALHGNLEHGDSGDDEEEDSEEEEDDDDDEEGGGEEEGDRLNTCDDEESCRDNL